jgi:hypothetical protein
MTTDQIKAALRIMLAVADTVQEEGRVPMSAVYLALDTKGIGQHGFEAIVRQLVNSHLIRREGDELVWVGSRNAK